jgi:hypothetical protein
MDHRMNRGSSRQLQPISDRTNPNCDSEGPGVFETQLLIRSWQHGRLNLLLQLHMDQGTHNKLMLWPLLICLFLHMVHNSSQVLPNQHVCCGSLRQPVIKLAPRHRVRFNTKCAKLPTIKSFKRRPTQCRVKAWIIPEFHSCQPILPFPGASVNETSQKCLEALVDPFSLSIHLWVVWWAHSQLNVTIGEQWLPKLTGETRVTVWYGSSWHAVESVNFIHENHSGWACCIGVRQSSEVPIMSELVHYHKNAVGWPRFGQPFNEVHGHSVPCFHRNKQWLQLV